MSTLNRPTLSGRLWRAATGSIVLLTILGGRLAADAKRKPNLLFLMTDEQRADTMAAYGNAKIRAPNLDRLARQGITFQRAYISQPVCTPSRSTLMTGLWPHTTGLTKNNIPLPADIPCLPELLADQAYRTAYMGKWHLGDEIFAQHGFQQWVSMEDGYAQYYRAGRDRDARSSYHHFLVGLGYQPDSRNFFSRSFAARRPIEHCKPKFLEREACAFLERHRDAPFLLFVSFLEPHMPFFGPLDNEYAPEEVTLPGNFNDPLEANEPEDYRQAREEYRRRGDGGKPLNSEADWRRLIARYWGLVTEVDRSVGAIMDTLDRLHLADNTIVVFTSDHGDMMGSHRLLTKSVMYEEAVHVPWLMRVPQLSGQPRVIRQPVSHIDMIPTLLDLMGAPIPKRLPGQSLVPLVQGGGVANTHVFIEWPRPACRTVIAPDGWKLCLQPGGQSQLYNLRDDPGECTNLYDSGKHRKVIERLTEKIRQWQKTVADPLGL